MRWVDQGISIPHWSAFDKSANGSTWDAFFSELSWSFNALLEGVWPSRDSKGNKFPAGSDAAQKSGLPLAEGYFACLWSLIGDLDYMCSILQLPDYASKKGPCAICKCTGGDAPSSWKDCRKNAGWVNLFWKKSDWQAWDGKSTCKLFSHTVGLSNLNVCYDWMHCKHLGTDATQFGSILYLLIFVLLPEEPVVNLKAVWKSMQVWYKEHKTESRYFAFSKITMFYNQKKKNHQSSKEKQSK